MKSLHRDAALDEQDLTGFVARDPLAIVRVRELVVRIVRARGYSIPSEAQADVVQEVLLDLWRAVRQPGFACGSFEALTRTIAYRACIDCLRRRRPSGPIDPNLEDDRSRTEEDLLARERREVGRWILEQLRKPCRDLIHMRAGEGLSYRQIAERQGRSEAALKVQMCQCLKRARAILERQDEIRKEALASARRAR